MESDRRVDRDAAHQREYGYSVREAKALHELGVRNHGWYMTETEHRGVLEVIERLEAENARLGKLVKLAATPGRWDDFLTKIGADNGR